MARRRALVEIEYETEANTPLTRETVEKALNREIHVACIVAEVIEDDIA